LTNIGNEELVLIAIQCDEYLGGDYIAGLADTFGSV
jgi:hypothetical protein